MATPRRFPRSWLIQVLPVSTQHQPCGRDWQDDIHTYGFQ